MAEALQQPKIDKVFSRRAFETVGFVASILSSLPFMAFQIDGIHVTFLSGKREFRGEVNPVDNMRKVGYAEALPQDQGYNYILEMQQLVKGKWESVQILKEQHIPVNKKRTMPDGLVVSAS